MIHTYKFADIVFSVSSLYDEVHQLCKDYRCSEPAEYSIEISQEHIDFEREKSLKEDLKQGNPVRNFSDCYLETLAVYRKICDVLSEQNVILFHGSVISVDGIAYLFTAKSGTGKSTHTKLWREYFGNRAIMINDDKPLIRISENSVIVYGTPWDGKHRLSTNTSVPLKAICLLHRGTENAIKEITKSKAYPMLIQQAYRPRGFTKMQNILTLIDKMCKNIQLYDLKCTISKEAVITAYHGMNKE